VRDFRGVPSYRGGEPHAFLKEPARALRRRATSAEQRLWQLLRGRRLGGFKFRRQHPCGAFVLDFFCAEARLVVELDGGVHDDQVERDAARTLALAALGFRVLRLPNAALDSPEQTCQKILDALSGDDHAGHR